jgi:hypothetical protein
MKHMALKWFRIQQVAAERPECPPYSLLVVEAAARAFSDCLPGICITAASTAGYITGPHLGASSTIARGASTSNWDGDLHFLPQVANARCAGRHVAFIGYHNLIFAVGEACMCVACPAVDGAVHQLSPDSAIDCCGAVGGIQGLSADLDPCLEL